MRTQAMPTFWLHDIKDDLDKLRQQKHTARKALLAIGAANGYGVEVPEHYDDEHEWVVTAGAIRKVACALNALDNIT